ncbi:hypothetical protein CN679_04860 [Bacillus pseudomycoides]|uniref:hypothetical protein n=1 Tax=Bacillus pseudomycoides TaxID=64104 RepID=UPI000BF20BCE|nr:hypothetical protein [Bacillus pseudomycoides]PEI94989.1 hypothetical protein CN679_04860 [Bacillus pseudomycoides]PHF49690.1 hypothetical protein COF72_06975 [Bacillus pseudomycoides]
MSQLSELELLFHRDMQSIFKKARDLGYNAQRFIDEVNSDGGYFETKYFIQSKEPEEAFTRLWQLNRLELTVEALILKPEYISLITEEERQ